MPRLCVTLPIYNGENFGEQAIRSILAQTYTDFTLVISDNGSTDRTEEICRKYAAEDDRIIYHRHPRNMGAAYNFNFAFDQVGPDAEYFKWASHDDVLAPDYLKRCVEVLDAQPEVVLCHARTNLIDDKGAHIEDENLPMEFESPDPAKRFRDLSVLRHACFQVFGVIRTPVLARTPRIGNYVGSDRVLLCELALYGTFHEYPENLFSRRRHTSTSCSLPEREERVAWFDPDLRGAITWPNWRILRECVEATNRSPLSAAGKFNCHMQIPEQMWVRRKHLGEDLVEGSKMMFKSTRMGHRIYYFAKRCLKPGS